MSGLPTLYSFRRCPFAMRARMALAASGQHVRLREIVLRDKPAAMLEASPKGTVPVLVEPDGRVLEESLDIMLWALERADPEGWLRDIDAQLPLIASCQADFKPHLDHYKYPNRYEGADADAAMATGLEWLGMLASRLEDDETFLFGDGLRLADIAIFPFVRQFANVDRARFEAAAPANLVSWLDRCLDLPVFAAVMGKYKVWAEGAEEPLFPAP